MSVRRVELAKEMALRVQSRSGKVHVIAEARDDVEVETDSVESHMADGGRVRVVRSSRGGSSPITVRCPEGTDVSVGSQAGPVRMEGTFGAVTVTTMSGKIEIDAAKEADLRSMAGSITAGVVQGKARLSSMSGKLSLKEAAEVMAGTVSGSITIGRVAGDAKARTVSGSIELCGCGEGEIAVKTISGRVHIELPEGTEPETVFKTRGRVRCDFAPGRDCRVLAASLSGSIEVVPS